MSIQVTITVPMSIKGFEILTINYQRKKKKEVHGVLVIGEWKEAR